jgi:hypothetical protein
MALQYFNAQADVKELAKTDIKTILTQDIYFTINALVGKQNKSGGNENEKFDYQVKVPFKEVDKFTQLAALNLRQKKANINYSVLYRLPQYLPKVKHEKGLKNIHNSLMNERQINVIDINAINIHLINNAVKFTKCVVALEEYFIWLHQQVVTNGKYDNRLSVEDVNGLGDYFTDFTIRNQAFHFNLPLKKTYEDEFKAIEQKFIKEQLPAGVSKIIDFSKPIQQVLMLFFREMNGYCYDKLSFADGEDKRDIRLKLEKALEKYFTTVIGKNK